MQPSPRKSSPFPAVYARRLDLDCEMQLRSDHGRCYMLNQHRFLNAVSSHSCVDRHVNLVNRDIIRPIGSPRVSPSRDTKERRKKREKERKRNYSRCSLIHRARCASPANGFPNAAMFSELHRTPYGNADR